MGTNSMKIWTRGRKKGGVCSSKGSKEVGVSSVEGGWWEGESEAS